MLKAKRNGSEGRESTGGYQGLLTSEIPYLFSAPPRLHGFLSFFLTLLAFWRFRLSPLSRSSVPKLAPKSSKLGIDKQSFVIYHPFKSF